LIEINTVRLPAKQKRDSEYNDIQQQLPDKTPLGAIYGHSPVSLIILEKSDLRSNRWKSSRCRNEIWRGRTACIKRKKTPDPLGYGREIYFWSFVVAVMTQAEQEAPRVFSTAY
jgi:hypothetical protein